MCYKFLKSKCREFFVFGGKKWWEVMGCGMRGDGCGVLEDGCRGDGCRGSNV
jgi:hypothetical protein